MVGITYVYRHYDKKGVLLYVGIATDVQKRTKQHKERSHWASLINRTTVQEFSTRIEAAIAELLAISKESPVYNVVPGAERKRKINNAMMFSVRVPEDLLASIDKACEHNLLSRSDYVRLVLEREFKK